MPRALIIGGPNGSGKTTFAHEFLSTEGNCLEFVNADIIAAEMAPTAPETANIETSRIVIHKLQGLSDHGEDFAFESTMAGHWLKQRIDEWRSKGYRVELYFLRLTDADLAVERVKQRVKEGGHFVPEPVIRRRFERGLEMFEHHIKALVDQWFVYDNSGSEPQLLEQGSNL
ncbi:MAG: zeta toxin family protein [Fimbriimonas sp.]|nr:zeta toxin family protein [Fimbriimonas sp.]